MMLILGLISGVINFILGMALILPFIVAPIIATASLTDDCSEPREFGVGYIIGLVLSFIVLTSDKR